MPRLLHPKKIAFGPLLHAIYKDCSQTDAAVAKPTINDDSRLMVSRSKYTKVPHFYLCYLYNNISEKVYFSTRLPSSTCHVSTVKDVKIHVKVEQLTSKRKRKTPMTAATEQDIAKRARQEIHIQAREAALLYYVPFGTMETLQMRRKEEFLLRQPEQQ